MPAPQTWRDTLAAIENGAARHIQKTAAMPVDPEAPDHTISMMHVFRGEDNHVLLYNGDNHVPTRDIKSSLRLRLEERLEKLEETGQQPADWDDHDTSWALHQLEGWIMQVARQHRRARPPKPLVPPLPGAVPRPDHFDWNYEDERALWVLRHHDGPANRIDFSRSLYVALYFACEPATDKDGHEQPGAVIALAVHPYYVREFDIPRARSQHAVLIPAGAGILNRQDPRLAAWPVPAVHKQALRDYLERMHGISEEVLFPDILGAVRAIPRKLKQATPDELEDLRDRKNRGPHIHS